MSEDKPKGSLPPFYDLISPKQAAAWLSKNLNNRPLNEELVSEYVEKISAGEWKERVHREIPVMVTPEGELINGQHRLSAIVKAGRSVLLKIQIYKNNSVSTPLPVSCLVTSSEMHIQ